MRSEAVCASPIHRTIADEIGRLAHFYGLDGPDLDAALQHLFFDAYTEIILGRDGFELLVGAVDARDRLTVLATLLGVPSETIRLFHEFSEALPRRIGYLKLCFGPRAGSPTMHCGAMVRWSDIFAFMERHAEFAGATAGLRAVADKYPLCHLVGFTMDRERSAPVMKLYWLVDQPASGVVSTMLESARVSNGRIRPESKRYFMGARWDAAMLDERWNQVVDVARREFTDSAWLCVSDRLVGGVAQERKVYVFRHDARTPDSEMARSFNLYYVEGLYHLKNGDVAEAARSFTNAILFQPDYAHAYNNRGYCWIQKGEFWRTVADCTRATMLDPGISTRNLDHARAMVPPAMGTFEWISFERSLARGRVALADDRPDRDYDLLDLPDGAAMLDALIEPQPVVISDSWFVLQPNKGGGDCLFHALAGRDLERDALLLLRRDIASVRLRMPEDPRGNMLRVVAALLQTPFTRDRGMALVADGVAGLSNEACAALQAVPGVFAGDAEIEQWCVLTGRKAVVVEASGAARVISAAGQAEIHDTEPDLRRSLDELFCEEVAVLFKTPGHWRRVLGVRGE
ncbi:hypothetical protein WMF30_31645 [Sorangium sp. So ce134]